ncbi:tRNA(His) guanylyltransferase Thg1 family protein [Mycobacteroides saopaulense]|nr:tRNA(His) guanylyltransferase Thg1 family protein [Mycobacteroides saopaulense]
MMGDSLGDRIKRYEGVYTHRLTPRSPLVIRVDGRAFHTYTKKLQRPFDPHLMSTMIRATVETSRQMQGFKLAYTQSDEATFLLTDYDDLGTQGWFGYELNKVVSLSASIFTAEFNAASHYLRDWLGFATFDARAFTVPIEDVPNVFVWRQRDWERNSLQMLSRSHFSHTQLHGKGRRDLHDMLHGVGVNWADLNDQEKNGTFVLGDRSLSSVRADYALIASWSSATANA